MSYDQLHAEGLTRLERLEAQDANNAYWEDLSKEVIEFREHDERM